MHRATREVPHNSPGAGLYQAGCTPPSAWQEDELPRLLYELDGSLIRWEARQHLQKPFQGGVRRAKVHARSVGEASGGACTRVAAGRRRAWRVQRPPLAPCRALSLQLSYVCAGSPQSECFSRCDIKGRIRMQSDVMLPFCPRRSWGPCNQCRSLSTSDLGGGATATARRGRTRKQHVPGARQVRVHVPRAPRPCR
jgi:hypothetical protein